MKKVTYPWLFVFVMVAHSQNSLLKSMKGDAGARKAIHRVYCSAAGCIQT